MPRDFQRSRVYKAEDACVDGQNFYTLFGMQTYVDRITKTRWWRNRAKLRYWTVYVEMYSPVRREDRRTLFVDRRRRAIRIAQKPDLNPIEVSEGDLIHDLAHFLSNDNHGPKFVRALLDLTRRFHSKPTRARQLAEMLLDHGVRVKAKPGVKKAR